LTRNPQFYLSYYDLKSPEIRDFETCASAGCRQLSRLSYTESEWQSIRAIFQPAQQNAAEERERLLVAVAAIETLVGEKNGTSNDSAKNQRKGSRGQQLDCIAEAANTTVALLLLQQDGLIRYHRVATDRRNGSTSLPAMCPQSPRITAQQLSKMQTTRITRSTHGSSPTASYPSVSASLNGKPAIARKTKNSLTYNPRCNSTTIQHACKPFGTR